MIHNFRKKENIGEMFSPLVTSVAALVTVGTTVLALQHFTRDALQESTPTTRAMVTAQDVVGDAYQVAQEQNFYQHCCEEEANLEGNIYHDSVSPLEIPGLSLRYLEQHLEPYFQRDF